MSRAARIDITIEELVLHGFSGRDAAAIRDALAAELAQQAAGGKTNGAWQAAEQRESPPKALELSAEMPPHRIGRQLALLIWEEFDGR